jgi:tripartite-type tricarboxylate transporter receptor subunit TctC
MVVYSAGGQGMTAMLGGHVDVWAGSLAGALQHVQANGARVFGVSAAERQTGSGAAFATFREQGIDAVYYAFALHRTGWSHARADRVLGRVGAGIQGSGGSTHGPR